MKIALAQINPTVGDFDGNAERILHAADEARGQGAELVVFPEMAVVGYPPRDLVEKPSFVKANLQALDRLAAEIKGIAAVIGFVDLNRDETGKRLLNAAAFVRNGQVEAVQPKTLLPTYDVFDERRYFEPAREGTPVELNGRQVGLSICEDVWTAEGQWPHPRYREDPITRLCEKGADVLVNLSASPFTLDKRETRKDVLASHAREYGAPLIYVNQVGGNDELVFDGNSMVFDGKGRLVAQAADFEEDLLLVDLDALPEEMEDAASTGIASAHKALILGTRDYVRKCGFGQVVVGLSGGIDSAVTAAVAAAALGPGNVFGVSMPSRFSSEGSLSDAETLARNLGIAYQVIPIEKAHQALLDMLEPVFEGGEPGLAGENLQARIRGSVLMALANRFGRLVLATGNKSELAAGYCTLYGDMCGALAVIGDLPKMRVYELARRINRDGEVIPAGTLAKAPSAELRPNQTDQDSLPPYELLDRISQAYVEEHRDLDEIVASGVPADVAADTLRRIDLNEYKRRQAAPVLKITSKAFGHGRRVPIAKRLPAPE